MGRWVLIVEDDEDIAEAIKEIIRLESPHHEVVIAGDGRVALDTLHTREPVPCLVFLDLHMPDLGGDAFLLRKHADLRTRDVPVVVMTATPGEHTGKDRVTRTIHKPFELIAILEELDEHCP